MKLRKNVRDAHGTIAQNKLSSEMFSLKKTALKRDSLCSIVLVWCSTCTYNRTEEKISARCSPRIALIGVSRR
jgi:hypothetical protein